MDIVTFADYGTEYIGRRFRSKWRRVYLIAKVLLSVATAMVIVDAKMRLPNVLDIICLEIRSVVLITLFQLISKLTQCLCFRLRFYEIPTVLWVVKATSALSITEAMRTYSKWYVYAASRLVVNIAIIQHP